MIGIGGITHFVGRAKITDPSAVQAKLSSSNQQMVDGMIFCEIPELGLLNPNLVPCRYGLSVPYMRVEPDDMLLLVPSINYRTRWFYIGFVDSPSSPTTTDLWTMKNAIDGTYKLNINDKIKLTLNSTSGEITIESVNGNGTLAIKNGSTQKIEFTSTGITIQHSSQIKIELTDSSVKINGTSLEVLP